MLTLKNADILIVFLRKLKVTWKETQNTLCIPSTVCLKEKEYYCQGLPLRKWRALSQLFF